MPKSNNKISIVFSFYNEQDALPLLIGKVRQVMQQEPEKYQLVFVNDASSDASAQVINQQRGSDPREEIVLVDMSRRWGVEECFLAGIEASDGDVIILMYTDMQDPPETISAMLKEWRKGAEIVHTIRRQRIGEHPLKKITAFWAYRLIDSISDIHIPCDAGDFKLISRRVGEYLLGCCEPDVYLRGLIPWMGFKQTEVFYDMQPRALGRSKIPLFGKKAWTVFLSGLTSFSVYPIHAILSLGLSGLGLSLLCLVILLLRLMHAPTFFIFSMLVIFLWSILMLSLGVLGLYLIKIFKSINGRPRYIIKDIKKYA